MDDTSPLPFAALMVVGFLLGAAGHVYKSPVMVGLGIFLVFLATLLLPLAAGVGH